MGPWPELYFAMRSSISCKVIHYGGKINEHHIYLQLCKVPTSSYEQGVNDEKNVYYSYWKAICGFLPYINLSRNTRRNIIAKRNMLQF